MLRPRMVFLGTAYIYIYSTFSVCQANKMIFKIYVNLRLTVYHRQYATQISNHALLTPNVSCFLATSPLSSRPKSKQQNIISNYMCQSSFLLHLNSWFFPLSYKFIQQHYFFVHLTETELMTILHVSESWYSIVTPVLKIKQILP